MSKPSPFDMGSMEERYRQQILKAMRKHHGRSIEAKMKTVSVIGYGKRKEKLK
jgi:hypothetical protein